MKKVITLFAFIGVAMFANGQSYTLTTKTATYTELVSPTVTTGDWKDTRTIALGFDFRFFNKVYQTAYVVPFLGLVNFTNANYYDEISVVGAALVKHSSLTSHFSYKIEGNTPNRIAKFQWKNGGFENDMTNQAFFNLQIWLYEGSNVAEIRHGSSQGVTADIFSPAKPIYKIQNEMPDSTFYLNGTPSSPAFELNPQNPEGLNTFPVEGTVYVLTPKGSTPNPGPNSLSQKEKNAAVVLYPNPSTGNLFTVESSIGISGISVTDIQGKTIAVYEGDNQNRMAIEHPLKAGIYLVNVNTAQGISIQKLIIN